MTLRHMPPVQPMHDEVNQAFADGESAGDLIQGLARRAKMPDFPNLGLRELCRPLPLPASTAPATFRHHVLHVLFVCGKKQVVGITAHPVVAFVADLHPCRNWTVGENPRNSMRKACSRNLISQRVKSPVASVGFAHRPRPAQVCSGTNHFGPKIPHRVRMFGRHNDSDYSIRNAVVKEVHD